MDSRPLKFRYIDGASIPQDLLREIWSVRVEMLELHITPEQDWDYFSKFVRRDDTAVLAFFDRAGDVQGFFTVSYLPVEHEGRKGLLFFSKYFYFRKAYRGHYKTMLAPWWLLPVAFRRFGFRSMHFVTSAYPQSFISLSRSSGNVVALRTPGISSWKKAALTQFVRTFYGDAFDEQAGLVRGQNVVDTDSLPRSIEAKRLATDYEVLNPEWRNGCTLPILFSVEPSMLGHNIRRMVRRALPGLVRGRIAA